MRSRGLSIYRFSGYSSCLHIPSNLAINVMVRDESSPPLIYRVSGRQVPKWWKKPEVQEETCSAVRRVVKGGVDGAGPQEDVSSCDR